MNLPTGPWLKQQLKLGGGGAHNPLDAIIASRPVATGSILSVSKIFSEFLDVAGIYWQQCIAESVDSANKLYSW